MGGMVFVMLAALKILGGRALAQIDRRFDKLEQGQDALRKELTDYRIDTAETYVTKQECRRLQSGLTHFNVKSQ
jgi:hypothetical protein